MAVYDLEEQEQIASLKAWWARNGGLVTVVAVVLALAAVGWQGWQRYQNNRAQEAVIAFSALQNAVQSRDAGRINTALSQLQDKYRSSIYSQLGVLLSARTLADMGEKNTAKEQLLWLVQNGKEEYRDLACLRAASLLLDEGAYDAAMEQLGKPGPGFEIRFAEMRGDILAAQNKTKDAKAAYTQALESLAAAAAGGVTEKGHTNMLSAEAVVPYRHLLEQKIDGLGEPS